MVSHLAHPKVGLRVDSMGWLTAGWRDQQMESRKMKVDEREPLKVKTTAKVLSMVSPTDNRWAPMMEGSRAFVRDQPMDC